MGSLRGLVLSIATVLLLVLFAQGDHRHDAQFHFTFETITIQHTL